MIPKIIHYCWFGGKPKPKLVLHCIESWKKYCPDYEIKEWNEQNYDISRCSYMHEAYKAGKWAFVSDYARIDILYQYGGIYLDTDVEVIKPLDPFLSTSMFCGWEKSDGEQIYGSTEDEHMHYAVAYGLGVGAEAGHKILKEMMDLYNQTPFYLPEGGMNLIPCPVYQTRIMQRYGLDAMHDSFQHNNLFSVYPPEYFCPKHPSTHILTLTKNTVCIHHFNMSWQTNYVKRFCLIRDVLMRVLPHNAAKFCARKINGLISRTLKLFTKGKYS